MKEWQSLGDALRVALSDKRPRLAALLMLLERGHVDARLAAALRDCLRTWRSGSLVPLTAADYRRQKRDVLLCALAEELAPGAGPATQARLVAGYLARQDAAVYGRYSLRSERLAGEVLLLGERIPGERQLRNVLGDVSAMQAARDFLIAGS